MKMSTGFLEVLNWIVNTNSLISTPAIKHAVVCNSKANDKLCIEI
jgi:hypothetical protein